MLTFVNQQMVTNLLGEEEDRRHLLEEEPLLLVEAREGLEAGFVVVECDSYL